mgnify:CR=1 FL=1
MWSLLQVYFAGVLPIKEVCPLERHAGVIFELILFEMRQEGDGSCGRGLGWKYGCGRDVESERVRTLPIG